MRLWRRPLCFTLKPEAEGVCWLVTHSNGVEHLPLGEARRQVLVLSGPRLGTVTTWEPWPPDAEAPLKPPAATLQEAGERLQAAHTRREAQQGEEV